MVTKTKALIHREASVIRRESKLMVMKKLKWVLLGLGLTVLFILLVFNSPPLMPVVVIETAQFPVPSSQMFYKTNEPYSEINSSRLNIDPRSQSFKFALPLYDSELRWDPMDAGGEFYVKALSIDILGMRTRVALEHMIAAAQIEKINEQGVAHFKVPSGSTDPQIIIKIPSSHIKKIQLIFSVFLGTLFAVITFVWIKWRAQIVSYISRERKFSEKIKYVLLQDDFTAREFMTLLGLGVLLNILPMVNFFLSVDDEGGAFRTDPSVWIADGRWTAFIVEKFIFPQPVIPYVPNLFLYVCLAAAFMLIIRAMNLRFSWTTGLAYCIFITHPIWWFIGEFYSNIPSTGLGVLCLSAAVYITARTNFADKSLVRRGAQLFSAAMLLAIAIGAYQSLTMFYIAFAAGTIIFNYKKLLSNSSASHLHMVKPVLSHMTVLIVGLIIYVVINKIAQSLYPTNRAYIDDFLRVDELLNNPVGVITLVIREMWKIYGGSEQSFGVSFAASGIVISLGVLFLVAQRTLAASLIMFIFVLALLTGPFLLHFITGAIYLPLRSMLAVSCVSFVTSIVILERKGLTRAFGICLSVILLFQMVSTNGQYAASTIIATTHDRLTAEAIYSRMAALDRNFNRDEPVAIDIYGKLSLTNRYPAPASSTMSASFFDWDGGNIQRMVRYMKLVGFNNLIVLDDAKRIARTPYYQGMPIWPAAGSVILEGGVYYVKLSEEPDPTHAKFH